MQRAILISEAVHWRGGGAIATTMSAVKQRLWMHMQQV